MRLGEVERTARPQELGDDPGPPAWSERVFTGEEVIAGALLPGFQGTVSELWINAELDEDEATDSAND